MMAQLCAVAAGGAIGSAGRFLVAGWAARRLGTLFPFGTLLVNTAGSFLIGVLFVLLIQRGGTRDLWHLTLIAGMLGGFTTFSAFSLETLMLAQQQRWGAAAGNVVLNLGLCLAATAAGCAAAQRWQLAV